MVITFCRYSTTTSIYCLLIRPELAAVILFVLGVHLSVRIGIAVLVKLIRTKQEYWKEDALAAIMQTMIN
jgi:hypothetical protein